MAVSDGGPRRRSRAPAPPSVALRPLACYTARVSPADPRHDLLDLLGRHRGSAWFGPDEAESLDRLEAFVRARPDCFRRETPLGHVTGSAWIVDDAGASVLLLHHRKLGLWLQPGGHADGDPDVARVALREAQEETGICDLRPLGSGLFDVDVHAIPARRGEPAHFHYDVRFAFRAPPGAIPVVSEESHALAWVPRTAVARYTRDRSVLRMSAKWTSGLLDGL